MATTQEHLDRFYLALQAWIDGGCVDGQVFCRKEPICDSAISWENATGDDVWRSVREQMEGAGLATYNPFTADSEAFDAEMRQGTVYSNPARLAWIKARADEAKARQAVAA